MNIQSMMQKAQMMQKKMAEMQERLGDIVVSGQAGSGMVTIDMTCKGIVQSVRIQPSVIDPSDPTLLEDLVKAALNDARKQADMRTEDETKQAMGGMGLPSGFKLPF